MKLSIITGGSRGLGKAFIKILNHDGWEVKELSRSGTGVAHIPLNLQHPDKVGFTVNELFSTLSSHHYKEVLLINNAGTLTPIKKVSALDTNELLENISVNLTSSLVIMQAFIHHFRDLSSPKTLVNISSGAALKGYPGWSIYCAGKAGCENFINSLAMEEAREEHPFRVLNFDPVVMDTQMQTEIRNSEIEHFPYRQRFIDFKESGSLRNPENVARKLLSLLQNNHELQKIRYDVESL